MKNVFELLANNLFVCRKPKWNLRCDLNFRDGHSDMQEATGCKLKKNRSDFSVRIGGCEVFLGEVNYDISSIPIGDFYIFEQHFTGCMSAQLEEFIKNGDKELVEKLHARLKDDKQLLRYIVKDCINGTCLTFTCELKWDYNNTLFVLRQCYCGYEAYSPDWLDYWYDRKTYFAG